MHIKNSKKQVRIMKIDVTEIFAVVYLLISLGNSRVGSLNRLCNFSTVSKDVQLCSYRAKYILLIDIKSTSPSVLIKSKFRQQFGSSVGYNMLKLDTNF